MMLPIGVPAESDMSAAGTPVRSCEIAFFCVPLSWL